MDHFPSVFHDIFISQSSLFHPGTSDGIGDWQRKLQIITPSQPVNDANDIAKTLRKLGFAVIHKENATQREIENSIREFGNVWRNGGGVRLFYYAGHGFQVNGINYIIPLDAEMLEETDVKYEAVDARRVLYTMYNAGN